MKKRPPRNRKPVKNPYKKIDYERVEFYAGRGLTKDQIALMIGIKPSTLYNKQHDDKKFVEAMDKGRAAAIAIASGVIFKNIANADRKAAEFFLTHQAGWKKTITVENKAIPVPDPDDDADIEQLQKDYHKATHE